jgi:hypothetical protein
MRWSSPWIRCGEEPVQRREQLAGLFNVWHVPAIVQKDQLSTHRFRPFD